MPTNESGWRLEQHVGTILQVMVVGLLGWSLKTSVDLRSEIGILQAKVEAMQTTMAQGTNDRYRGTDAARDFQAVWGELGRLGTRMERCEERHAK